MAQTNPLQPTPGTDYLTKLADRLGESWPSVFRARESARVEQLRLREAITGLKPPANTSVVGFGSLARGEWTSASDLDWTLMIDGPADIRHLDTAKDIETKLVEMNYPKPGPTGTFGSMSSSHELVHHIGGAEDTNQNITRRILLLLEAVSLSDEVTLDRVTRTILERYIVGDPPAESGATFHVPLFLLNDVVRFWRTMTVDYATKKWQRSSDKWAIKNIKLRMSRKLLFTKGMLMCFLCHETFAGKPVSTDSDCVATELLNKCFSLSRHSALELLAFSLDTLAGEDVGRKVLGAYNHFLATVDDRESRTALEKLKFGESSPLFNEMRQVTREFTDGLVTLFFDSHETVAELTRKYGVF